MSAPRCYWCGRFGAALTTYQLHPRTARFVRWLCPGCARHASTSTRLELAS